MNHRYALKRTDKQIDQLLDVAIEAGDVGSKYPGMTYEQGVADALEWILGDTDENPLVEDSEAKQRGG